MVPPVVQRTEGCTLGSKAAGNISQKMNVPVNTGWKNDTTQKHRLKKRHITENTGWKNDRLEKYRLEKYDITKK